MQKKSPNIIIIEGFWGVGKSTLISSIRRSHPVLFIPEPNHIEAKVKSDVSRWYQSQHNKRIKLAKKYVDYGEDVILERSILSSAAFFYAQHGLLPKWFNPIKLNLHILSNLHIIFLYGDKNYFFNNLYKIKNKDIVSAVRSHESFYENYLHFFVEIAPRLIGLDIKCIKIGKNSHSITNTNKLIQKILKSRKQSVKRKLSEIKAYCASAVMFYEDKFLLLYSKKHGQFSFPQGHQEEGEKLIDTVIREIKEETGFNDFEVITPIKTYGYRFYDNNKITHKIISCFLVRLRSLKKAKKCLESHESFTNHFFTIENAIEKLSWEEDKEMIRLAKKKIKTRF